MTRVYFPIRTHNCHVTDCDINNNYDYSKKLRASSFSHGVNGHTYRTLVPFFSY